MRIAKTNKVALMHQRTRISSNISITYTIHNFLGSSKMCPMRKILHYTILTPRTFYVFLAGIHIAQMSAFSDIFECKCSLLLTAVEAQQ